MPSGTSPAPEPGNGPPSSAEVGRRREVAIAGHTGDLAAVAGAIADVDPGARAVALGALRRVGRLTAPVVVAALADPAPTVRRRACEELAALLSGPGPAISHHESQDRQPKTPSDRRRQREPLGPSARTSLAASVTALLTDGDGAVVEAACFTLGELLADEGDTAPIDGRASFAVPGDVVAALSETATDHPDPLCREAAVAALGSIGDRRGLAAILTATTDRPAVRRRAVLALAPFVDPAGDLQDLASPGSGAEVGAALARALQDRDWQVRQAAEDLTAE